MENYNPLFEKIVTEPPEKREQGEKEWKPVTYEGCSPSLPKGGKPVDVEQKLAAHTLVLDTGVYESFLDRFKDKKLSSADHYCPLNLPITEPVSEQVLQMFAAHTQKSA